ncbi:Uncharacterised protein [Burkholderia pseudomallei]|nr:Uncharacterised protein [Burkholderia pseudomallei]
MHRARPARSSRASSREAATCPRYRVANRRTLARTAQADCGKRAFRGFASFGTRRVIASPARCFLSCRIGHRRLALSVRRLSSVVCRLSFVVRRSEHCALRRASCVVRRASRALRLASRVSRLASRVSRLASRVSRLAFNSLPPAIRHSTSDVHRTARRVRHSTFDVQRATAARAKPHTQEKRPAISASRFSCSPHPDRSRTRFADSAASPRQAGWAAVPPSDDGRRAASCCA